MGRRVAQALATGAVVSALVASSTCVFPQREPARKWRDVHEGYPRATVEGPGRTEIVVKGRNALLAFEMERGPGVYRSLDEGRTWSAISLPVVGRVDQVAFDRNGFGILVLSPRHVLSSADDGEHWRVVPPPVSTSLAHDDDGRVALFDYEIGLTHVVDEPSAAPYVVPVAELPAGESPHLDRFEVVPRSREPRLYGEESGWTCKPSGPPVDAKSIEHLDAQLIDLPNAPFAALGSDATGVFLRYGDDDEARVFRDGRVDLLPPREGTVRIQLARSDLGLVIARRAEAGPIDTAFLDFRDGSVRRISLPKSERGDWIVLGAATPDGFVVHQTPGGCLQRVTLQGDVGACRAVPLEESYFLDWASFAGKMEGLRSLGDVGAERISIGSELQRSFVYRPRHTSIQWATMRDQIGIFTSRQGEFSWFTPVIGSSADSTRTIELPLPRPFTTALQPCIARSSGWSRFRAHSLAPLVQWDDGTIKGIPTEVEGSTAIMRVSSTGETCAVAYGTDWPLGAKWSPRAAHAPLVVFGSKTTTRAIFHVTDHTLVPAICTETRNPASERWEVTRGE